LEKKLKKLIRSEGVHEPLSLTTAREQHTSPFRARLLIPVLLLTGMAFALVTAGCASPPPPEPAVEPAPPPPPPPPPPELAAEEPAPDTDGPVLGFRSPIEYFSPDGDGENDVYIAYLSVEDASPIANWSIDIREPEPPHVVFGHFEDQGVPPAEIRWDGRSPKDELIQSASDYPFVFTVTDIHGNVSQLEGIIKTDILVIREGDRLKAQVPSIVFAPNTGSFQGLSDEVMEINNNILRRVAQVLNKFSTYKVTVEGHANPTARSARERAREHERELKPLSTLRAQAVLEKLVEFGVDRGRLSSEGAGGSRPVAAFEDRDGWWKNRRVDFILVK
jgi:outer membrane protein OmpA-like peptidoglycan-associated protein